MFIVHWMFWHVHYKAGELLKKSQTSIVWGTPGGGVSYRMFIILDVLGCSFKNAVTQSMTQITLTLLRAPNYDPNII
eukprot:3290493-Amphidinium_carterae.1